MIRTGQPNFSKGIISDRLLGRVDVAAYNAGVKQGENVVVLKQGALTIRPGFEIVSECIAAGEWLMPFQFSNEQAYALALGPGYMQPLTNGGVVLEEELEIVGITNGYPMVVEAQNHGLEPGDRAFIDGVEGDLGPFLNNRIWTVGVVADDDHFAIPIDGTALPAFTSAVGGITRADPPDPPPAAPATPAPYVPPIPPPTYGGGDKYPPGYYPPWYIPPEPWF